MAEEQGGLYYTAYIDNWQLQQSAEESKKILSSIGDSAEAAGQVMDNSMALDLSSLRQLSAEASSIFASLSGSFETETMQDKIDALNTVIETNKAVLQDLEAEFGNLQAAANEAFASGDFDKFDEITLQMEEVASRTREVSTETQQFGAVLDALQPSIEGTTDAMAEMNSENENSETILVRMLGGQQNFKSMMDLLPGPIKGVVGSINSMTAAAMKFIMTPIGAIITAIVVALKALSTWFKNSADGQMAFAKISGYVAGVLNQLKEIVMSVGKFLYKAFSDPKQAIKDLWEAIKTNIINRFTGLMDVFKGFAKVAERAFKLDWKGVAREAANVAESMVQAATGVDDMAGKMLEFAKNTHEAAKETAAIREEALQLEQDLAEWEKRKEELEGEKAENRMKMYDTSLSQNERKAALDAYKAALEEQLNEERKFADKKIELQKRAMELTTNPLEDEKKLKELEAARIRVETAAKNELAALQRRANSITNPRDGGDEGERQRQMEAEQQRASELLNLQRNNRQAEIDQMEEGSRKKIEQLKLNYEKEIEELKVQEKKWAEAQGGALTNEQQIALTEAMLAAEKKKSSGISLINQEDLNDALKGIETYEQRRTQITEEYSEKRKKLYTDEGELRAGVDAENLSELNSQESKALDAVDEMFASRQEEYLEWCQNVANMSLEQLVAVVEAAQNELKALETSGAKNANQLAAARAKLAKANKELREKQKEEENETDTEKIAKRWKDVYEVVTSCNQVLNELGDAVGGTAGEFIKTASTISTATMSMVNGIVTLVTSSSKTIEATAVAGVTALSTMEKASIILTIISSALQISMAIASMFNKDKERQARIDELQRQIDGLKFALEGTYSTLGQVNEAYNEHLRLLEQSTEEVWKEFDAISAANGIWVSSSNTLKQWEQQARNAVGQRLLREQAEQLAKAYANVSYAADRAMSLERFDKAKERLENLAQQQMLIAEKIRQETDGRKEKNIDKDQIASWEKEIEDIGAEAVAYINDLVEDIIGGSATDIAKQLGDAFISAFEAGEDAAQAWGDKVNDIVADVMRRMLVSQFLEQPLAEIFDKYKSKWFKDGNFEGTSEVIRTMQDFAADLNNVGDQFSKVWDSLPDNVKSVFTNTAEAVREASAKGIAQASQESVDELNGRMTAVQGHTYTLMENSKILVSNTSAILRSVIAIESNTNRLESLEQNVKFVRNTLDDMYLKGIKIK